MAEDTDRMEGVNVGDLEPIVDELSFPVTADEVVAQFEDHELDRTNAGPISIGELLEPMGETEFHSSDDLETMILGQMPEDSEGRENYSDRGGSTPTEPADTEAPTDETGKDQEDEAGNENEEGSNQAESLDDD